jgi:Protein of unknown function (DUF2934)
MNNTGRKTVKGRATSAPMLAKATTTKIQAAKGTKSSVTREDVARRSYEIFLESGGAHGHDVEHWIQAERDLGA